MFRNETCSSWTLPRHFSQRPLQVFKSWGGMAVTATRPWGGRYPYRSDFLGASSWRFWEPSGRSCSTALVPSAPSTLKQARSQISSSRHSGRSPAVCVTRGSEVPGHLVCRLDLFLSFLPHFTQESAYLWPSPCSCLFFPPSLWVYAF